MRIVNKQVHDERVEFRGNLRVELTGPRDRRGRKQFMNAGPRQPSRRNVVENGPNREKVADRAPLVCLLDFWSLIRPSAGMTERANQVIGKPPARSKIGDLQPSGCLRPTASCRV